MIKLLIGGSPCTHWSIARLNDREVESSGLGWELFRNYVVAKQKFNPDFLLYENVESMSRDIVSAVSSELGVQPVMIDGGLVSAADRKRFYWTNVETTQPENKGLVLKDILEPEVDEKYFYKFPVVDVNMNKQVCGTMVCNTTEMNKRVFNPEFKCHTLTAVCGGYQQKKVMIDGRVRKLTPVEYERCMTLPDNYTAGVGDCHRYRSLGNGWTAEVIIHILNGALKDVPKDEEIVVLSMYDGIATGRYCLDKMGFTNVTYFAYEIDNYAKKIASKNYPDIIHKGNAFDLRNPDWAVSY